MEVIKEERGTREHEVQFSVCLKNFYIFPNRSKMKIMSNQYLFQLHKKKGTVEGEVTLSRKGINIQKNISTHNFLFLIHMTNITTKRELGKRIKTKYWINWKSITKVY